MHCDGCSTVILAGIHVGCYELFGGPTVHSISDLRGKRVAVTAERTGRHIHLAAMAAYVVWLVVILALLIFLRLVWWYTNY